MNESTTLTDHILSHIDDSMTAALSGRTPLWARSCSEMSDVNFIKYGILRCIGRVNSGRDFLQTASDIHDEAIPLSTYFNSLKSSRRMQMLESIEEGSYTLHCEMLASHDVNYLEKFPELDSYAVMAADGHFIDHACHTKKDSNGKVFAAGFIYAMNLRNGLLRPLCCITNGTRRNHEIPVLRNHIEAENEKSKKSVKCLYVYDKAVTDFRWWNHQKQYQNYMISVLKENSAATLSESIPFEKGSDINVGIEAYSLHENGDVKFSVVEYRDPETAKLHRFVTTLPMTINPGAIAMLYFKRWTIEKAFNNSKSDLKEKKAWSSNMNALKNQMRLTAIAYNLMRVFEEVSKRKDPELIHPSDKKYTVELERRELEANKLGRFVNRLHFNPRIARISSRTIQAAQNAIAAGKTLAWFVAVLAGELITCVRKNMEH